MLRRLQLISLSILTAFVLSASNAAAAPVLFDIAGPGATGVDTNPGTDVSLTALVGGTILDLNVFVEITGDHMEDLDLYLTSPGATTVHFRRNFSNPLSFIHQGPPLSATFDDEALAAHDSQGNSPVGVFQPFQALSAFDGQPLAGIWTLTIFDGFFPFEGDDLVSWRISGTVDQVPEPATLVLLGGGVAAWLARRRRRNDPATALS